jgi:hypothetical protein
VGSVSVEKSTVEDFATSVEQIEEGGWWLPPTKSCDRAEIFSSDKMLSRDRSADPKSILGFEEKESS